MSIFLADQPDPAAMLAALQSEQLHYALLLELQFASGTLYLSDMLLPFVDLRWGNTWQGMGAWIGMDDVSGGPTNLAPMRAYHLGVPRDYLNDTEAADPQLARLPALLGNRADYKNREATLYLQMFAGTDAFGRAQALGYPIALDTGVMDQLSTTFTPSAVNLTLTVESFAARKGSPVYGMLTYRDQLRRHAGDIGLDFVPEVMSTNVTWPKWT